MPSRNGVSGASAKGSNGKRADSSRLRKEFPSRARPVDHLDPPVAGKTRRDFTRRVALSKPVSSLDGLERAEVRSASAGRAPLGEIPLILLIFIPRMRGTSFRAASRFSRVEVPRSVVTVYFRRH